MLNIVCVYPDMRLQGFVTRRPGLVAHIPVIDPENVCGVNVGLLITLVHRDIAA